MKEYLFGADVGGTTVKLGVFRTEGILVDKWEIPTRTEDNGENIIPDIADTCQNYIAGHDLEKDDFAGIGMGIPGPVKEDGTVQGCVNLGWGFRNVKKEMEKALGIPAYVDNDANAAALGEMWAGGAKGVRNLIMITLGTGLGGGIIINEKTVNGSNGFGGEIGHITIHPEEEERCGCGRRGCIEQFCSANGIVRVASRALKAYKEDSLLKKIKKFTSKDIFDAAKKKDAFAISQLERFGNDLGLAMSNWATMTDPEIFVIGGGVSRAGKALTDVVGKYYRKYALPGQRDIPIVLATLGNDAGIYGCARLVIG